MVKRHHFFILIFAFICVVTMNAQELSKKEKRSLQEEKQFDQLKEIVQKDSLEIVFDHCNPTGMGYKDLTTNDNYLRLRNDSAYAYLPYFGVAYKARLNSEGGIKFEDVRSKEKVTMDEKKKKVIVVFEGKNDFDQYRCMLSLFANGTASLVVNSNYYQTISYDGKIEGLEK